MPSGDELPEGFITTIADDEEIKYDDSESEEDEEQGVFTPGFFKPDDFSMDGNVVAETVGKPVKRKLNSLDQIIARIRKENQSKLKNNGVEGEKKTDGSEEKEENTLVSDSDDACSDDEIDDTVKIRKKRKRKFGKATPEVKVSNLDVIDGQQVEYDDSATFAQMGLSRCLLKNLEAMKFRNPTPIQFATIPVALMGRDVYGCAATGTGKTAAFMLPVLERLLYKAGPKLSRVLILLPTRELAVQVYEVSQQLSLRTNIEIALCAGGLDIKPQEVALKQLPDIIIATPGRLLDHLSNTPSFYLKDIQILILDEADRILDEYFEEQMKEIMTQCANSRQTMLFSATLNDNVEDLAATALKNPVKILLDSNTDVALNLHQEFIRIREHKEADREAILAALVSRNFHDHVIVFVQTKKQVHRLHVLLGLMGIECAELHGNMRQTERLASLQKFKDETVNVLVATDVAARGLDIAGVKTVINFTMPCTLQHYIHRVGRTARAGHSGRSVSMVGQKERKLMKEIIKKAKNAVRNRLVPQEIVAKYSAKVEALEKDLSQVMREEKWEKEFGSAEQDIAKVTNLCTGVPEEKSREWFQTIAQKKQERKSLKLSDRKGKLKKGAAPSTEDRISVELQKAIQFRDRAAKRSQKPKRMRMAEDEGPKEKSSKRQKKTGFDNELVNISKSAVKQFRYKPIAHEKEERRNAKKEKNKEKNKQEKYKTKSCKKFKSKSRYNRRK